MARPVSRIFHCTAAAALCMATSFVDAETLPGCVQETDDSRRLACYDKLFRDGAAAPQPSPPSSSTAESAPEHPQNPRLAPPASGLDTFWELNQADKRGTFIVRTYLPNYLLPAHFSSRINRDPASPTHPAGSKELNYRSQEAKLQISLRAKVAEDLLLPQADLWFAYTQRSLWQLWNKQESAPFRSTDYQPEAIYVVPIPQKLGTLPGGWRWQMVQLGLAHQSNGQSDPLSRSWNRTYLGTAFEKDDFWFQVRTNQRLKEPGIDDNPDLTSYIGRTEITAYWLPSLATVQLAWRTNFNPISRGSLQLDWTYPVSRNQPTGLRWYAQLFTGYGETLLDYNRRQTSLGVGLTLFQF